MSTTWEPRTYMSKVGRLRVSIDYEALAVTVERLDAGKVDRTEDLGDGVLIDRDAGGEIVAIEVISGRS